MSAKPTILAFHGSGSNSTVHSVQLARVSRILNPHFEIVSVEAPFPSAAGPGVLPFFEGCGPYKRWVPPSERLTISDMKSGSASSTMPVPVEALLSTHISTATSTNSKIVGVIGFSQGTRVVAGILKGVEILRAANGAGAGEGEGKEGGSEWMKDVKFAVSMCGSYPPALIPSIALDTLDKTTSLNEDQKREVVERKIEIPTLHVQGKQDEWEWAGKLLIDGVYEVGEGKSEVYEFEMGHHYPVQAEDTEKVAEWILRAAKVGE